MKTLLAAAVAIAFVMPAHAQEMGKRPHRAAQKVEKKKKFDAKAYRDAAAKIPDAKQDYDPWRISR